MIQKTNRILIFAFPIILALMLTWDSTAMCEVIHEAVKNNSLPEVRRLVENNPNLVFSRDENGFTPLHLAAANGYKSMVEFLLTTKADVNAKDNAGSTPLHQAAAADGQSGQSGAIGGHDTHSPCDCHACLGWLVSCFGACPSCDAAGESA
jgi:hypothetical protein